MEKREGGSEGLVKFDSKFDPVDGMTLKTVSSMLREIDSNEIRLVTEEISSSLSKIQNE